MLQMKQTAVRTTATPLERAETQELQRKIGSTTYLVRICFSATSRETLEDKLLRLFGRGVVDYA